MTKQALIDTFYENHQALVSYIDSLTEGAFSYSHAGKWTAGQQLGHIHLCLQPLAQVLASKEFIKQQFGTINRPALGYDDVISNYKDALAKGGKAPERFVPQLPGIGDKKNTSDGIMGLLHTIKQQYSQYTDEELDTLTLPHPLLGTLTIREMFCLMAYHATHHHTQTTQNLAGYIR